MINIKVQPKKAFCKQREWGYVLRQSFDKYVIVNLISLPNENRRKVVVCVHMVINQAHVVFGYFVVNPLKEADTKAPVFGVDEKHIAKSFLSVAVL